LVQHSTSQAKLANHVHVLYVVCLGCNQVMSHMEELADFTENSSEVI